MLNMIALLQDAAVASVEAAKATGTAGGSAVSIRSTSLATNQNLRRSAHRITLYRQHQWFLSQRRRRTLRPLTWSKPQI